MSLPTEVVENIAVRLSRTCLLAFRRAHPQLANCSSDAFNKAFLRDIIWFIGHRTIEAQIRGLLTRPHFASRVVKLRVEPVVVYCHAKCLSMPVVYSQNLPIQQCVALMTSLALLSYGPGSPHTPSPFTPKLHAPLAKMTTLPSLRSLHLCPTHASRKPIRSLLSAFSDRSASEDVNVDLSTLVALLSAHKLTLHKVELTMVCLRGSWLKLLAAVRQLPENCKLQLFAPSFVSNGCEKGVQFLPQSEDVDRDAIKVEWHLATTWTHFSGEKRIVRLGYDTRDNKLHRAVDCMTRSYRVVAKEPYY